MLQVEHAVVILAFLIELAQQVFDAFNVGGAVTDDDGVGCGNSRQVTVLRHQGADQRNQLGGGTVLHLDQSGFQTIRCAASGIRIGLGLGVGHDARLIALSNHAETVGGHHRKKQLIDLGQRQWAVGHHADLALDPRVDDKGLPADLRHLIDEFADIGTLEVDGPAFLLLADAGRHSSNGSTQR